MLDRIHPWGRALSPAVAAHVTAEVATEAWQLRAYEKLRRAVFVAEQGLFDRSDRDDHDAIATPIVAIGQIAGMPDEVVGVVRIYEAEPGVWYGGRLCVAPEYRRRGAVGAALIAAAVSTAHAWGCRRFLATVQEANVRYFERYHFRVLSEITVCERRHALMQADLASYPPRRDVGRRAA